MGILNKPQIDQQLDVWLEKTKQTSLKHYRDAVWAIFRRILQTTPQWSGKAVANWKICIDTPDFSPVPGVGSDYEIKTAKAGHDYLSFNPRHMGNNYWIDYAETANKPKLFLIKGKSKVFICNGVQGDSDSGMSDTNYLASLQEQGYWAKKLRLVNMPYETAFEVVLSESWKQNLPSTVNKQRNFFL